MGSESLGKQFEAEGQEPTQPDLRVDFMRHGKAEFTAEEIQSATNEGNLTAGGIKQIKERAVELAGKIDKEKELVVFWVSPKRRAQQAAKLLLDIFQEQNIPLINGLRTVKSLSDVKVSPDFITDLSKNVAIGKWMEYWTESNLPEGTEKPGEVKKRVERIITYLERIARDIVPAEGRKLHFICVGHEEIFRDLLEEAYGLGTKANTGPGYGEVMSIDISKSAPGENAVLKLKYHDQEARLEFDKDGRKFYRGNNL